MMKKLVNVLQNLVYKYLKISYKLQKEITRYVISFFFAWLSSALISDFHFYRNIVINLKIAEFLTTATLEGSNFLLELANFKTTTGYNTLNIDGSSGVIILYGCLGIRQFAFVIVFILLQTGRLINKLWYIPISILILYFLNCFRIALIAYWQTINPQGSQMVHDVASPFIMYPAILFLWIYWLNKYGKTTKSIHK